MKSNEKLEMKFHLKAKHHIHSNLHVVKWSDKDGPPYSTYLIILIIVFLRTEAKIFEKDKLYGEESFEI